MTETKKHQLSPMGYSFTQLELCFLKLGKVGFGKPVAIVGYMHRDIVERQTWISGAEYE